MQKFTAVLEKKIEWIALGLAVLWALAMVWFYGINSPASVQIGSETYGPGDVDQVPETAVISLKQKMGSNEVPRIDVPALAVDFRKDMDVRPQGIIAQGIINSLPAKPQQEGFVNNPLMPGMQHPGMQQPGMVIEGKMSALPEIPAPELVDVLYIRDYVIIPPPQQRNAALMAAANAGGGMIYTPPGGGYVPPGGGMSSVMTAGGMGFNNAMMQPPMPMGGGAAAAGPGSKLEDRDAITVFATLDEQAIEDALAKATVPEAMRMRLYVSVELERQEMMSDGTWGPTKLIPPLEIHKPLIDKAQNLEAYADWVCRPENQLVLLQPPFYQSAVPAQVAKWQHPKMKEAMKDIIQMPMIPGADIFGGVPQPQVDPAYEAMKQLAQQMLQVDQNDQLTAAQKMKFKNDIRARLTPEQRRLLTRAEEELKKNDPNRQNNTIRTPRDRENDRTNSRDRENDRSTRDRDTRTRDRDTSRDRDSSRDRRSNRNNNFAAQDPSVLMEMYAQARPRRGGEYMPPMPSAAEMPPMPAGGYVPMNDPSMMMPGMFGGTSAIPGIVPPNGTRDQFGQIIPGKFDLWAHDETVEAGKTYRYRVRVTLRNPVYGTNLVTDSALARPLELPVDKAKSWSAWTNPVAVKPRVQLFLAGDTIKSDQVRIDVYRYLNGKVNKPTTPCVVGPGDAIGGLDATSRLDFSTGWTVADVRRIGGETRVTMIDDAGRQQVRTVRADGNSTERRELEQEAAKPSAPGTPGSPMNPGAAPMMMPGMGAMPMNMPMPMPGR